MSRFVRAKYAGKPSKAMLKQELISLLSRYKPNEFYGNEKEDWFKCDHGINDEMDISDFRRIVKSYIDNHGSFNPNLKKLLNTWK